MAAKTTLLQHVLTAKNLTVLPQEAHMKEVQAIVSAMTATNLSRTAEQLCIWHAKKAADQ